MKTYGCCTYIGVRVKALGGFIHALLHTFVTIFDGIFSVNVADHPEVL